MHLNDYFTEIGRSVSFTESQASAFAKGVAGDFNPLHDPGHKRFCVPGDLIFSVLLHYFGIAGTSAVQFSGMLDGKTCMQLPELADEHTPIADANGKTLLSLFFQGTRINNADFIAALSEQYVRFSGKTFPDILVPLMREAEVMINPDRPMVIYKDMSIELSDAVFPILSEGAESLSAIRLELSGSDISIHGRKGAVNLQFTIAANGLLVGKGEKNMVLSGLRAYDDSAMQDVVSQYNQWRREWLDSEQGVS
ncbi:MAG: DUF3581 family protein [Granulosicoccus sp.]